MPFEAFSRRDGIVYYYTYHPDIPDQTKQARIVKSKDLGVLTPRPPFFDARIIGLSPTPFYFLPKSTINDFVGNGNRDSEDAIESEANGSVSVKVAYSSAAGLKNSMVIDKTRGANPVTAKLEHSQGSNEMVARLATFKTAGNAKIWFPQEVEVVLRDAAMIVRAKTITTIHRAEFNKEIDPKTFTMDGMEIMDGTRISDMR
ncbi:MAG: hypothetical protein ACO1RA_18535 [Planctomycetaceae bacterium]